MGGSASEGLGRGDVSAIGGPLSTESGPSPPARGLDAQRYGFSMMQLAAVSLRLVPTSSREKPEVYRRYRADETLQRAELMGELLTSRPTIPST